jgi:hypothetical protein
MTVADLIAELQKLPQDIQVEVNDNNGGEVFAIDQVDHFDATDYDPEIVIIQVNC